MSKTFWISIVITVAIGTLLKVPAELWFKLHLEKRVKRRRKARKLLKKQRKEAAKAKAKAEALAAAQLNQKQAKDRS